MNTVPPAMRPPRVSAWSVLSLLFGLGFCPLVTVLAVPLGLLGLRDARRSQKLGRTASWIGIVLGLVITPLTTWGMLWWNDVVRMPMLQGPYAAIVAGQHGDVQAFELAFTNTEDVPRESVGRFLNEVQSRWGMLNEVTQDQSREAVYSDDESAVRIPYSFHFQSGTIPGEAEFILNHRSDEGVEFVYRFSWVLIGTGQEQESAVGWPPELAQLHRDPLPARGSKTADVPKEDVDRE